MCFEGPQISQISEEVYLKRKYQCLDQLWSLKSHLCSACAKHKNDRGVGVGGLNLVLENWQLLHAPVISQGCDLAETSSPCVPLALLFFLFFLKRKHISQSGSLKFGEKLHTNQLPLQDGFREALVSQERHLVSYLGILKSIFTGCISKRGGSPSPSSMAVMPKDQTSQRAS